MKKKLLIILIQLLQIQVITGQNIFPSNNLVKNPDFKNYTYYQLVNSWDTCIRPHLKCGYKNDTTNLSHVLCLNNWITPTLGTPDYQFLDSCNYWNFPFYLIDHMGTCRIEALTEQPDHIFTNHEYIQGELMNELIESKKYCVAVYIIFDNFFWKGSDFYGSSVYFISSIGVYFSKNHVSSNTTQALYEFYPPQIQNPLDKFLTDSVNWMLISDSFLAEGGENFLTIGNFLPDTLTPYIQFRENQTNYGGSSPYLIGFVGVYDCTGHEYQCNAGEDIRICRGEVVQLGTDEDSRRQYHWSPGKGLSDSTAARPLAAPTETTTYFLRVVDEFLQQSYDTVTVEVVECNIWVPNSFTPNRDGLNDELCVIGEGIEQLSLVIFNRRSEVVFETKDQYRCWDGTYNGRLATQGVYVYLLSATLADGTTVNRDGVVMLIR